MIFLWASELDKYVGKPVILKTVGTIKYRGGILVKTEDNLYNLKPLNGEDRYLFMRDMIPRLILEVRWIDTKGQYD